MPFPITCAACHKTFSIADDVFERKVKGRIVTIKCKQCQSGIRVDGTKDKPVFSVADSVRPPPVAPAEAPAPVPTASVAGPTVAPVAAKAAFVVAATKAAPVTAKAATAPKEAAPAVARKAAPAVASTSKASATLSAAKAAPTAAAPKIAAAAMSPKPAPATPLSKPAIVAAAPKAEPAVPKAAPRAPLTSAAAGVKPAAATPKAPAVAPAAKASAVAPTAKLPAPMTKAEPLLVAKAEPLASVVREEPTPTAPRAEPATTAPAAESATAVENLWAVDYPDGEDRELTLREIEKELAAGAINLSTLVWREGMAEWLELGQLPELSALLATAAVPAKPELPVPPPQQAKQASRPAIEAELSATLPQPTLPLPPQRLPAPSAPVIDFADHDALRATPPPPIPKLSPAFSTGHDSRPPTPPVFASGVPAIPANPVPAFPAASTAPLTGSALAAPVPARANLSGVAPVANVEDWPQKSRAPWIIFGIAVLAAGGLVFFLTRSTPDELPPPVAISALPASAPSTPPHVTEPEPAATSDSATAAQQGPGSNAAMQPPDSAPLASPNAGFAELFASGARNADEKSGVSGPGQRFDPAAAKTALAAAANQTAVCREKGGPTGNATVVVTFDPSGKVASATVSDAPFAGTSSGACIAATMKHATVRAFSGLPGTVTKVISIQ